MGSVWNRTTREYRRSVSTPDYADPPWKIDPDTMLVVGVDPKYWIADIGDVLREMTSAEKDTAHLADAKSIKFATIDVKTQSLIAQGFSFAGKVFSLSTNAQSYWLGMMVGKDLLTYPLVVNTLDDASTYSVTDAVVVQNMYATAMGTVKAHLASGTDLKNQVRAAVTIAGVDAVVDNR